MGLWALHFHSWLYRWLSRCACNSCLLISTARVTPAVEGNLEGYRGLREDFIKMLQEPDPARKVLLPVWSKALVVKHEADCQETGLC